MASDPSKDSEVGNRTSAVPSAAMRLTGHTVDIGCLGGQGRSSSGGRPSSRVLCDVLEHHAEQYGSPVRLQSRPSRLTPRAAEEPGAVGSARDIRSLALWLEEPPMKLARLGPVGAEIPALVTDTAIYDLRGHTRDIDGTFLVRDGVAEVRAAAEAGALPVLEGAADLRVG